MSRDTSTTANASVRSDPGLGRRSPGGGPGPASRVRSDCVHGRPGSIWHVSERSTQLSSELASSRRDPQDRPSASSTSARLPAPPKNPGPEPQGRAPTRSPVRSPLGGTRHDQSHATKSHQDHVFPNMIQDRRARQCCGVPAGSCAANNRRCWSDEPRISGDRTMVERSAKSCALGDHGSAARGSRASCRPSPRKLNAITVVKISRPG